MLVTPAPIVAYIVCFSYLDSSTIKSQLPELVHSFTEQQKKNALDGVRCSNVYPLFDP